MNKPFLSLVTAALLTILSGCSTLKVSQDYDQNFNFSRLNTFSWQNETQPKTGDIRVDSPLMDQRIRGAVKTGLAAKGITNYAQGKPDFQVSYTYTISKKIQSTPVTTGVGMGYGRRGSIGGIGVSTGSDIREYDQGLLVLDFLAPDTQKLLWRGTSTRIVDIHADPEKTTRDIHATVEKLLEQYPPK